VLMPAVRPYRGRLSALSVSHRKSDLDGAFVWAHRVLNHPKRRFSARAVAAAAALSCTACSGDCCGGCAAETECPTDSCEWVAEAGGLTSFNAGQCRKRGGDDQPDNFGSGSGSGSGFEGPDCPAQNYIAPGPGPPGRLSARRVSHTKSFFVWRFCMGARGA
jgi:hypothetical protein